MKMANIDGKKCKLQIWDTAGARANLGTTSDRSAVEKPALKTRLAALRRVPGPISGRAF